MINSLLNILPTIIFNIQRWMWKMARHYHIYGAATQRWYVQPMLWLDREIGLRLFILYSWMLDRLDVQ